MKKTRALMLKKKRKSNRATQLALMLSLAGCPVLSLSIGAALVEGTGAVLSMGTVAVLGFAATPPAHAAVSVPIERVADGQVVSKANTPVSGAIVFLKDSRSQSIRTFICDQQGHFHFGQLTQDTDYQLWAEANGARSKTKAISSFDSKNDYNFTLKIDATK
jgi:hypothetical protein